MGGVTTSTSAIIQAGLAELASTVRAGLIADLDRWRQVPWAVLMGAASKEHPTPAKVKFTLPGEHLVVVFSDPYVNCATHGLWPLYRGESGSPRFAVDCSSGDVVRVSGVSVSDTELLDRVIHVSALFDPTPLLEPEPAWRAHADAQWVCKRIVDHRITPHWTPRDRPLQGMDAALYALAAGWSGSVAELVDAAQLMTTTA